MDIYARDKMLKQIALEIKKNQNSIGNNVAKLSMMKEKNDLLREVYDDYKDYKNYIVNDKLKQENELLSLLHYLEKSMLEADLTDRLTRQAKHEQQVLLGKLSEVRNELSEITQKAENIKVVRPENIKID